MLLPFVFATLDLMHDNDEYQQLQIPEASCLFGKCPWPSPQLPRSGAGKIDILPQEMFLSLPTLSGEDIERNCLTSHDSPLQSNMQPNPNLRQGNTASTTNHTASYVQICEQAGVLQEIRGLWGKAPAYLMGQLRSLPT